MFGVHVQAVPTASQSLFSSSRRENIQVSPEIAHTNICMEVVRGYSSRRSRSRSTVMNRDQSRRLSLSGGDLFTWNRQIKVSCVFKISEEK